MLLYLGREDISKLLALQDKDNVIPTPRMFEHKTSPQSQPGVKDEDDGMEYLDHEVELWHRNMVFLEEEVQAVKIIFLWGTIFLWISWYLWSQDHELKIIIKKCLSHMGSIVKNCVEIS